MKTLKLLSIFTVISLFFTSCDVTYVDDTSYVNGSNVTLNQMLNSYDLWYVDINQTTGYGQTPFLQKAFTVSFLNGNVYANNNLVGIGSQGNGLGIYIGSYDTNNMVLDVYHTQDGYETFDVYQTNSNTIELYNPYNDTSYFLRGYQRSTFDYDYVFYDNIHYFLQEYVAWEKTYVSAEGVLNEFDNENYLQFLAGGNDSEFRSSQDLVPTNIDNLVWDYTGLYGVANVPNNMYLKTLTLDYDYFDNEHFELSVLNDARIELHHAASGTTYEFDGRGYIQYRTTTDSNGKSVQEEKLRKQKTAKKDNPRESKRKLKKK